MNPRKSCDTLATESPDKPGLVIASAKLKALDRRQRMIAEKRITDTLFDLVMERTTTSFNYTPQST